MLQLFFSAFFVDRECDGYVVLDRLHFTESYCAWRFFDIFCADNKAQMLRVVLVEVEIARRWKGSSSYLKTKLRCKL
jgi:hypothetical protein